MDLSARRQAELPSSRRLFADFVEARLDHLFQRLAGIDHGKILGTEIVRPPTTASHNSPESRFGVAERWESRNPDRPMLECTTRQPAAEIL